MAESERDGQHWDPGRYARDAGFVAELGRPVVDLLAPRPGERILDLGCGDGALTEVLRDAGVHVVGVDASAEQVAAARDRLAGGDGSGDVEVFVMDGQALDFPGRFDAVFSNAALHWMPDADAVIAGVWRALKPGGRFVGEMGGAGNVGVIAKALAAALESRGLDGSAANPWFFPSADDYRRRLEAAGFHVCTAELFARPTPVPAGMGAWLETFAGAYLSPVPAAERGAVLDEVTEAVRPALMDSEGNWTADYVRLRFFAERPA